MFWQVVLVQQPVQYGRGAAHISWAAWVQTSLEDCMEERQRHLNESSSARLRRSQNYEAHIFWICADILDEAQIF